MKYRWESGMMFIDESGHFPPKDHHVPIVASLLVPDNEDDRRRLSEAARLIRLDSLKNEECDGRPKPHFMSPIALEHLAGLIREHWFVGYYGITFEDGRGDRMREDFGKILADLEEMRRTLPNPNDRVDFRLDWLMRQLRDAIAGNVEYLALLLRAYQKAALWFREEGIRPRIVSYMDDKLPRTDVQLHAFLIRLSFCVAFPDIYGERKTTILGLRPCPEFRASVSSDADVDGLAVVSAIAWVRCLIERKRDPDGRYQRLFDLMTRTS